MRIHVTFIDRVGITQEVLALLGGATSTSMPWR